jgi:hypothetical protein
MKKYWCLYRQRYCDKYNEETNTLKCGCDGVLDGGRVIETEETKETEAVKHPAHYNYSKYEPVKVIKEWGLNFNLGNVIKYVARAGRKDDILQDLKKARQYLDFEIEALEEGAAE